LSRFLTQACKKGEKVGWATRRKVKEDLSGTGESDFTEKGGRSCGGGVELKREGKKKGSGEGCKGGGTRSLHRKIQKGITTVRYLKGEKENTKTATSPGGGKITKLRGGQGAKEFLAWSRKSHEQVLDEKSTDRRTRWQATSRRKRELANTDSAEKRAADARKK